MLYLTYRDGEKVFKLDRDIRKKEIREKKYRRRKRQKPCLGKIGYDTPEAAMEALQNWRDTVMHVSKVKSGAYKCPWCEGFHLTSSKQSGHNDYLEEPPQEDMDFEKIKESQGYD